MTPQRVRLDVTGMWFALWPGQAEVVAEVVDRVATSANVGTVLCKRCGAMLAELRETRDIDGTQGPLVFVQHSALAPGARLINAITGDAITVTGGSVTPANATRKRPSSMTAPGYAVIVAGTESQPVAVNCGHHGHRGHVTAAELIAAAGRAVRR